ncbi:FAD-dependent monooxygenase [Streptomyces sp. NPDC054786]
MGKTNVLISGASVAGPALAYWLQRYGFAATVVERAPALREGGFSVDFRGTAHMSVLRKMGILDDIRALRTGMGEVALIDAAGRRQAAVPSAVMSGEVELQRGDLSRVLYEHTKDTTEYVFGDSITSITETAEGVHATFERSAPRTFDLVVGADGLHSNVRRLVFGEESRFIRHLGCYVAGGYRVPNRFGLLRSGVSFGVPGKSVTLSSARNPDEASPLFVFAADQIDYDRRDVEQQKKILAEVFSGVGWEVPGLLDAMRRADDFYFDSVSQIRLDRWSTGRAVLLGDAGYGATMGGMGTGLAIVGAYVLAGELAAAGGDHRTAFAAYEAELRDYAEACQKLAEGAGQFFAPQTRWQIWRRNQTYRILSSQFMAAPFNKMTTKTASAIALRDYGGRSCEM